jgi:hypothetical protein
LSNFATIVAAVTDVHIRTVTDFAANFAISVGRHALVAIWAANLIVHFGVTIFSVIIIMGRIGTATATVAITGVAAVRTVAAGRAVRSMTAEQAAKASAVAAVASAKNSAEAAMRTVASEGAIASVRTVPGIGIFRRGQRETDGRDGNQTMQKVPRHVVTSKSSIIDDGA